MSSSEGSSGPTDPLRRLQAVSANYQQTARWLAGSFGALGVVLVAGLSLSSLGTLSWWRLALAGVGVLGALVAVMLVILRTAMVYPMQYVTFEQVGDAAADGPGGEALGDKIEKHDGLFPTLTYEHRRPNLLRQHIAETEGLLAAAKERGDSETDLKPILEQLTEAKETANRVLAYANNHEAKRAYDRLWRTVLGGALAFVVGAGTFAWASTPPTAPAEPTTVVVVPSAPSTTVQS